MNKKTNSSREIETLHDWRLTFWRKRDRERDRERDRVRDRVRDRERDREFIDWKGVSVPQKRGVSKKKNQWKKQQFSLKNMRITYYSERCSWSAFLKFWKCSTWILMKSYEIFKEIPKGQKWSQKAYIGAFFLLIWFLFILLFFVSYPIMVPSGSSDSAFTQRGAKLRVWENKTKTSRFALGLEGLPRDPKGEYVWVAHLN